MTETTGSTPPSELPAAQTVGNHGSGTSRANALTAPTPEFAPTSTGNKLAWVIGVIVVVFAVALLIAFFGALRHWFALHTGTLHGGPDIYYNFWSGFGSDLGEATLISAVSIGVYTGVRKVNCHTKGCWRIGHHPLDGTPYILCKHHHPNVPNHGATHEHILEQHRTYLVQKEAERKGRVSP
jgi:hypothetical protein